MNDKTSSCFWGSKKDTRWGQMVPVWLQTPVGAGGGLVGLWAQRRSGGTQYGASFYPDIWCARHHLPLFDSPFPASQSKLITSTVTFYQHWCHRLRFISGPVCPPSPCINIDRLTRSHQRPYRCFLPAPALDAPTSDQFLHHHKLEPPTLYGPRLASWGKWATSCSALVVFSAWIGDKQTWGGQKPLIKRSVPSKQWGR